jgi:hypothetical protein
MYVALLAEGFDKEEAIQIIGQAIASSNRRDQ